MHDAHCDEMQFQFKANMQIANLLKYLKAAN